MVTEESTLGLRYEYVREHKDLAAMNTALDDIVRHMDVHVLTRDNAIRLNRLRQTLSTTGLFIKAPSYEDLMYLISISETVISERNGIIAKQKDGHASKGIAAVLALAGLGTLHLYIPQFLALLQKME